MATLAAQTAHSVGSAYSINNPASVQHDHHHHRHDNHSHDHDNEHDHSYNHSHEHSHGRSHDHSHDNHHHHLHNHRHTHINHNEDPEDDLYPPLRGPAAEREMRWELRYFFMNPYMKYKVRGRKPWKLGIQVLKICVVTLQLVLFGTSQFSLNQFYEGNQEAFEHLFLTSWDTTFDSQAYPKSSELYALYRQDSFYAHIDYVAYQFANLKYNAIGTYEFDHEKEENHQLHIFQEKYQQLDIRDDGKFVLNQSIYQEYISMFVQPHKNISVRGFLDQHNQSVDFDTMRVFEINFAVSSVHLKNTKSFVTPDCIKFNITIKYDNKAHSGRIPITLNMVHGFTHDCFAQNSSNTDLENDVGTPFAKLTIFFDTFVIVLCLISAIMCVRSIVKALQLERKTEKFFKVHFNTNLEWDDRFEFLNLWYVLIIVSDVCTIIGTVGKILIEGFNYTSYDTCSILLGMGCFLVWFGVLRYLGFFNKYNILVVTLKNAMPNVLRFLICAGIIYAAYAFFGWIVLGPYHPKFKTLDISVECMFSLINGDDMYATFREMSTRNQTVYVLSRIYLYTFISLFIYVVLSLIIALIMDTYETMKEYQKTGYVEGKLKTFMAEGCDDDIPGHGSFHTQSSRMERWRVRQKIKDALCCRCCSSCDDDEMLVSM